MKYYEINFSVKFGILVREKLNFSAKTTLKYCDYNTKIVSWVRNNARHSFFPTKKKKKIGS